MVGTIITILIFGYAGWTLYRHIRASKAGACAGCSHNKSCSGMSCCPPSNSNKKRPV